MAFVTTHPDELLEGVASNYIKDNPEQVDAALHPYKGTIYEDFEDWLKSTYGNTFQFANLYSLYKNGTLLKDNIHDKTLDRIKNEYLMSLINADNALDISKEIANNSGFSVSPEQQQIINNFVSENMANTANTRQIEARDSSLLSTAQQLQQLGLNMGSVASLGGASAGVAASMAQADKSNNAQQMRVAKFNEKAQMTRTLIGLLGGMASAGIYGGAVSAAKKAASQLANEASHYATDTKFAMFDNYERVSYKTRDGGYLAYNHYKW